MKYACKIMLLMDANKNEAGGLKVYKKKCDSIYKGVVNLK